MLRLSYSLLSLWKSGKKDEAIDFYLKKPRPLTFAIKRGKEFDDYANAYITSNMKLPQELGGKTLESPRTQVKLEQQLSDDLELVTVFDVLTPDTLIEIKCGVALDSADYENDYQVALYLYMCQLQNIPVTKAEIIHYNPMNRQYDKTLIWNNQRQIEKGKWIIDRYAKEIEFYFREKGIIS